MATNYPIDRTSREHVLAIDPGLRHVGVAVFGSDGKMLSAALAISDVRPPVRGAEAWKGAADAAARWWVTNYGGARPQLIVVEEQKINDRRTRDPDDVLQCNGAAGALTMIMPTVVVRGVIPENWKGSIKKEDMTERIRQRLAATGELSLIQPCAPSLFHNILDACGIGLWLFGRLTPQRVIHRE